MPCNCNKTKEADDKGKECPEGQSFDVSQGKCVAKEAIGDPQAASTLADPSDSPLSDPGEKQEVKPKDCPEGHTFDAEQDLCVPTASDKTDDIGQTKADITTERVPKWAQHLSDKVNALSEKKPTAQVGLLSDGVHSWKEISENMAPALRQFGKFEFDIPLESLRNTTVKTTKSGGVLTESFRDAPVQLQEVVAISGTHATQDLDTDVAIVPGGISFKPVFQFAKVKRIEAGADRARFFKTTIPANGTQTVGSTPTEATQTFTSVEVTPSTITGVYLIGDFDEIENSPFDLLQAIVEGSAASYEDFVATDMLTTVSAEGTLTPGLWIRGDTGATITSSDIASNTLDETGLAYAREYLENQGYLRGGIKPVAFLHPQQWRELITSTNVTSLATRSAPDIWLKAELENFMGIQLVVTNAVENETAQTNNAYNAIVCVPKHSYGIGIKRDVTVKMHEIGEDNQVRVNTTWRTKTGVIDATSIVRVSTTAP
jgi:hypothetical protein